MSFGPHPRGQPGAAAVHPVLLMNPKSGGGKAVKFDLAGECAARNIEAVVLGRDDDLLELAEDAIAGGADVIGMAGGDGSQALIATVASRHGIPHVVVPAGTRNHFALDLGLDRDDVVGALDAFADASERTIDLATVNGRVFVNNASLGLYAKIVQAEEYRDAKMRTAAALLPDLLGPDAEPLDLQYTGPDGTAHETAHMVLVSNNAYQLRTSPAEVPVSGSTRGCWAWSGPHRGCPSSGAVRGTQRRRPDPQVLGMAGVDDAAVSHRLRRPGRDRR